MFYHNYVTEDWGDELFQWSLMICTKCGSYQPDHEYNFHPYPRHGCPVEDHFEKYVINYYGNCYIVGERIKGSSKATVIENIPCTKDNKDRILKDLENAYPDHIKGLWDIGPLIKINFIEKDVKNLDKSIFLNCFEQSEIKIEDYKYRWE